MLAFKLIYVEELSVVSTLLVQVPLNLVSLKEINPCLNNPRTQMRVNRLGRLLLLLIII